MQRQSRMPSWGVAGALLLFAVGLLVVPSGRLDAQGIPLSGQDIAPAYEGWRNLPDGSIELIFGYFNRNLEEELNIPVGPDNNIEPGGPDLGQPTHFYPRRNRFVFRVRVPKDFGETTKELVWTLVSQGRKNTTYATLHPDYYTDDVVVNANNGAGGGGGTCCGIHDNKSPELTVEGPLTRTVRVGEPVELTAVVTDDGLPEVRRIPLVLPWTDLEDLSPALRARGRSGIGARCCQDSTSALRLNWYVYRGPAAHVTFDRQQFEHWEDFRDGRNSPFSAGWEPPPIPPGNRWTATATFGQPGTYVLRTLAHDGGLDATEDITVVVE